VKNLLMTTALAAILMSSAASAEDVKIGVILGFTGPIESLTPGMGASGELAMKEVSDSGKFLDGSTVTPVRGDSTCVDSAAASAAAERLITSDKVSAIFGADWSGVTGAILQNVARPNGIVMISPSATSPALSDAEDDGLFFRTAPSDARQGQVLAEVLTEKGVKTAALTYTNNDYGKGLAESIKTNAEAAGIEITIDSSHEDGKGDYSAEVGALAQAGGDVLIVAGAKVFGKAIALYRIPQDISAFITANIDGPILFILAISVILLLMGLVFEALSMVLIMTPVLLPSALALGFDPIWFGVYMVVLVECALITPPVGLNLYVIQSVAKTTLGEVSRGVVPFLVLMLVTVALLYIFPDIALYIPFKW